MPIRNRDDAVEVEGRIASIFESPMSERGAAVRALFVEVLDFDPASGQVDLGAAPVNVALPTSAERIASLDGVQVVYVALETSETDRVRKGEASAAAKRVTELLGEDLLLVFTNTSTSQLHLVYPSIGGVRPVLRRMVVERDLPRRTAVQQVSNIYWNHRQSGSIRLALDQAFDAEPVTRDFFSEYKRVFEATEQSVTGFGADEGEARRRFVQTLFNRLMFVYFLSRKGWLIFKGDKDYLNALWSDYRAQEGESKNFYVDRLRLLFFAGLNNPQSLDLMRNNPVLYGLIGGVRFLNGGLFEETDLDERAGVAVPDEAIEPILRDLFERFNFTVMESTPFDVEVAVDPEMLGKVFEELVTGRHNSGAYYTPRPVVSFMCREALKGYLKGQDTGVAPEAVYRFVDERDTSGISSVASARRVAEALDEVTVVDPACGSGAYLLGMMQELVELQTTLFNVGVDPKGLYDLKLHIIERNLYGVDIDDFAVNIAMLRLWLSLAIEYEGETPPPLPNLDFKTLCGDSLLGPDPGAESYGDLFRHRAESAATRLAELKAGYMKATTGKDSLKGEIERVEGELREALADSPAPAEAIDWRVHFAEVFAQRGGFDIAIANPPYVRVEDIGFAKAALSHRYGDILSARSDVYCYFYVRSLQLLTEHGMQIFVCSNTWLDTQYGESLQRHLLEKATILSIFESAVERQFSTAAVNTLISIVQKTLAPGSDETTFVSFRGPFDLSVSDPSMRKEAKINKNTLSETRFGEGKWGGKYLRAPDIYAKIVEAASSSKYVLSDFLNGERYLNTGGADGFFILTDVVPAGSDLMKACIESKEGRKHGSPQFFIESRFLKPGYRKQGATRLIVTQPDCYVLSIPPDTDVSRYRVSEYLAWGEDAGFNRRSVTKTQSPWWRPPLQAQSGALLLWPRTHSDTHKCLYNPDQLVSLRYFRLHPKRAALAMPLLGILNSTVFALLKEVHGRRGLGHGALETGLVDVLPLPLFDLTVSLKIKLADAIGPLLDRDIETLESEVEKADRHSLDEIILEAYGLNPNLIEEVYESVIEMVRLRRTKSKSIS